MPQRVLESVWTRSVPPSPPQGTTILDPTHLAEFIDAKEFNHVVFTNANMAPHLRHREGTSYVFDMFAPKILELLSSDREDRDWLKDAAKKERAMALADHVWVNGRRKFGYALGWLLRPSVHRIRCDQLGKTPLITGDPLRHVSVVDMPVPMPNGVDVRDVDHGPGRPLRVGIAGYAQRWSVGHEVSPAQRIPLELGHEVHVLAPQHWGGSAPDQPDSTRYGSTHPLLTHHAGPLDFAPFARWLQSMDVIADAYEQTAERTMAMITRTAVALRFGVPVIHGVESEVSDLVREYDAGWVVRATDEAAWKAALTEASDEGTLRTKQRGAARLSSERFAPAASLRDAQVALPTPT